MKAIKLIFLIIVSFNLLIAPATSQNDSAKVKPQKFFIAKTDFGIYAQDISLYKLDAALNFAAGATQGKYQYLPFSLLDSIVKEELKNHKILTAIELAEKTGADFFIYYRVNRLHNILRVDMSAISVKDTTQKRFGVGYAAIRYKKLTDQEQLTDPALLTATMRAFAVTTGDSSLYVLNDSVQVKPLPTLAIGGINYINDETEPLWEIFREKEISSYDAVINIFDEIKDTPFFVVYDIETRDSVYALFNLLMVENYKTSTSTELKALYNMDVNYFITGILTRDKYGAILDLYFCRLLKDGKLAVLQKATGLVKEDSIKEFKDVIRKTVNKLMKLKPWTLSNQH